MPHRSVVALAIADALLDTPPRPMPLDAAAEFTADELDELVYGIGIFRGMSKVLIALGLEPESIPIVLLPTPGSLSLEATVDTALRIASNRERFGR